MIKAISPAKINRFLSVGSPDPSGYHPIRTIFQTISLADELTIELSSEDVIICNWPDLPAENTLTKSLRLLRELVPVPPLKIVLHKNIPSQAGLGGGSSNAAAFLRAINHMRQNDIEDYVLEDVAKAVGADVPFFLVGGLAKATGYGEILTPLPDPNPEWLVVVKPDQNTSTAEAYQLLDSKPREFKDFPTDPLDPNSLYNDFERVGQCVCCDLEDRLLTHGAIAALMSGSGSAVFGLFPDEKTAINCKQKLEKENFNKVWVCQTLSRKESLWTTS